MTNNLHNAYERGFADGLKGVYNIPSLREVIPYCRGYDAGKMQYDFQREIAMNQCSQ